MKAEMVYFDIDLYHRGHFGHVDGVIRYIGGEKLVIGDNDSDFWSVFEADEQVRRLGDDVVAALWYKDPTIHNMSIGLRMFLNDEDAIEMVRIAQLRGHVELFVVHDQDPEEGFPEIGYIDVGGDPAGEDEGNVQNEGGVREDAVPNGGDGEVGAANVEGGNANEEDEMDDANKTDEAVGEAAAPIDEEVNEEVDLSSVEKAAATEKGEASEQTFLENEEIGGDEDGDEDSEDAEYVPFCDDADSVDDVQFTDSEEDFDLDDNFFGVEDGHGKKTAGHKGKGVVNEEFDDDGEDSDEMEGVYATKDEFKDAVIGHAVYTKRGIKFEKVDTKRVIVSCQKGCSFRLYCVKMNGEDTWQLRSARVGHSCVQVQRVGILKAKWLGKEFKKKV
ncbi:hypothetical protein PIB30_009043 [Stylosanthes scabra]|uniref:PB1-like domain-containing protein n=1 Tax=Stylosanthes scabra TaxID=79078 RepID=A0ABU6U3U5_9FABA|nr:hypothetical protein [Stylosanthes scabra]